MTVAAATATKAPPPPARVAPPPPKPNGTRAATPAASDTERKDFSITSGVSRKSHRIGLYGSGGVGKSSLAALIANVGLRPVFLDIEDGSADLDVARVTGIRSWTDIRDALHSPTLWNEGDAVVIDSATKAEEMAMFHTLTTVPHEKGHTVTRVEEYGFGKGFQHIYETFLNLLGDLDQHHRAGRSTVLIMHDATQNAPNPMGEDFLRYEPRLQASPKCSIRSRVKEWLDHLLFVGYDVFSKDGKATGSGTRTIYPQEMPTHWAKSRTLQGVYPFTRGDFSVWQDLFGSERNA